ncbi:MAG: nitroreductase/quinone reductase family protein, partial [Microbacteriaceae bacterium]
APAHPSWYRNLSANPQVHVQVYDRVFAATARTASEAEKPALWSIMSKIWPDYREYAKKTTRDIPVVILDPVK